MKAGQQHTFSFVSIIILVTGACQRVLVELPCLGRCVLHGKARVDIKIQVGIAEVNSIRTVYFTA